MSLSFHHLGIAAADGAALAATFGGLLDASVVHEEGFDGMTVRFLGLEAG